MPKLKDKLIQAIQDQARQFAHDRTQSVGASETFSCSRKNWFAKHTPDATDPGVEKNWGILERGNIIENAFFVPKLRHIFGSESCLFMGDDQVTLHVTDARSSSTSDGMVYTDDRGILADDGIPDIEADCFLAECKSFDPRMNLREEKEVHRGQAIMQLGHFREKTEHKPVWAILIYINASDLTDIRVFPVRFDEEQYEFGKARNTSVFTTRDPFELMAEGAWTDQCKYCPFTLACGNAEIKRFPTDSRNYTQEQVDEVHALAIEYDAAREAEKAAIAAKGLAGEKIKTALSRIGNRGVESPDFKATYSKMDGKTSLDKGALNAFLQLHGADIADFEKSGGDFTRLTVTLR